MNKKSSKGISLISLIITIIVIIILAAIVIFSGMGTPEKAQLSAVISDIDNVQTAVDQAYYGFYTEKSVAGEVWTKSQFYEAVATGETDRNNLSGAGIVEISDSGMVKMNLPKYEGRKWGVAVEDIDETTQTGSVVLLPGYETDGKIYSTLLDTQNGGRTTQLDESINANILVKDLKITTDSSGTALAGEKIDEGTKLYISFDVSQNASAVTVTPSIPYEVTENGSYLFILTNAEGKTRKYKVNVDNYLVPTLPNIVKLGDYVDYKPDVKTYTTRPEYTGASAQTFTTQSTNWRVVGIDEKNGKTYITSDKIVNSGFKLGGILGYYKGDEELNRTCAQLYSNERLETSAESYSSQNNNKIYKYTESTEKRIVQRIAYYLNGTVLNSEKIVEYNGEKFNQVVCKAGASRFYIGSGEYDQIRKDEYGYTYVVPLDDKPVYIENNKPLGSSSMSTDDILYINTILRNGEAWIAFQNDMFNYEGFQALGKYITVGGNIAKAPLLYYSTGSSYTRSSALRPIVEIDSSIQLDKINNPENDGSTAAKAWKLIKK